MIQTAFYDAPYGRYEMAAEDGALTGVWLEGQKYFPSGLPEPSDGEAEIFARTRRWLDAYFAGRQPDVSALPMAPKGSAFARRVWQLLLEIPYGQTCSYGEIALRIGQPRAARAVGMANNRNRLLLLIPCHRVIGADGSLVGFGGGGIEMKRRLLELERRTCGEHDGEIDKN